MREQPRKEGNLWPKLQGPYLDPRFLSWVMLIFDCKLLGFFESEVACGLVSPSEYILSCVYVNSSLVKSMPEIVPIQLRR
jgi:hypothetical protein